MKYVYTILFCFTICCYSTAQCDLLFPKWLEGSWQILPKESNTFEEWSYEGELNLKGQIFLILGEEKILLETMEIKCINDKIVLEMNAMLGNYKIRTGYYLDTNEETIWSFYNGIADYPNRITYLIESEDSLNVWIEGIKENQTCMEAIMVRKQ